MSEQPMGPGWWIASDGRWYPPEQHPDALATGGAAAGAPAGGAGEPTVVSGMPPIDPTLPAGVPPVPPTDAPPVLGAPPPAPTGRGSGSSGNRGRLIAVAVIVLALLVAAGIAIASRDDSSDTAASDSSSTSDTTDSSSSTTKSSSKSSSSRSSKSSSSDPLAIKPPSGFTAYRDDTNGFAVALPERYATVDLSSGDIDAIIQQLQQSNPKLADLLTKNRSGLQQGITMFAYDTGSSGDFTDNVNIIKINQALDPTTPAFLRQVESQLTSIGASGVTTSTRQLPSGKAGTATFTISTTGSDGAPVEVHGQQGYVSAGRATWVISASTQSGTDAFDTMLDTFTTG